ncbi:TniQ family protein [Paenibacillus periandrae]|uniref:TniQ family protein n=1 Tax=Paenibacillus periandrae TaxID=1761741 RepID=UPI001F09DCCF|nr:TniQ family protein [Paenibacillus periandrae]
MVIVWRKQWVSPFESPWSIFEKIALANQVKRDEILHRMGSTDVKNIKNKKYGDNRRELFTLSGFDSEFVQNTLGYDLIGHNKSIIARLMQPVSYYRELQDSWFFNRLRWCQECIQVGQHSLLHQFKLIKRCPVHETILFDSCPSCLKQFPIC